MKAILASAIELTRQMKSAMELAATDEEWQAAIVLCKKRDLVLAHLKKVDLLPEDMALVQILLQTNNEALVLASHEKSRLASALKELRQQGRAVKQYRALR